MGGISLDLSREEFLGVQFDSLLEDEIQKIWSRLQMFLDELQKVLFGLAKEYISDNS